MQDIHAIGCGSGGGFTATGVGGDRRLRPHGNQIHQALKCPRCDSLNTKFCYYNNYNLSQPRHFCKSCRRYWTKGGVLRNVPVGGGCRKSKRSSKSRAAADGASDSATASASAAATATAIAGDDRKIELKSNSHSSSESSSLTATATTAAEIVPTPEPVQVPARSSNYVAPDLRVFMEKDGAYPRVDHQTLIDHHHVSSDGQIFSFTNMMTSSNEPSLVGFNGVGNTTYGLQQNEHALVVENQSSGQQWNNNTGQQQKMVGATTSGFLDQVDLTALEQQSRGSNDGLDALDWDNGVGGGNNGGCGGGEQGLFDYTSAVDHAYWSQTQWVSDTDQSLNFFP